MIKILSAFGRKALEITEGRKVYNIYIPEQYWIYIEQFKKSYLNLSKDRCIRIIKNEKYSFDKLTYYIQVWEQTEKSLQGFDKKDFKQAIDHIVPITYGYKNKINSYNIGSKENLQPLSHKDNLKKNSLLTSEALRLINKWNPCV